MFDQKQLDDIWMKFTKLNDCIANIFSLFVTVFGLAFLSSTTYSWAWNWIDFFSLLLNISFVFQSHDFYAPLICMKEYTFSWENTFWLGTGLDSSAFFFVNLTILAPQLKHFSFVYLLLNANLFQENVKLQVNLAIYS